MSADWDWGSAQLGSAAENYQAFMGPGMFRPFAEVLLAELEVSPGERVLDVACGTGVVSREAASRVGAAGGVTGVDLAEPMLDVARAQPPPDGTEITYMQGSAEELPVDAGAFDVATCQQGLQFFPDRAAALAQMRRALVPGGRLGIATWVELDRNPVMARISDALGETLGAELGAMVNVPFALNDPDELRGLVEDAGFADVRVRERTLQAGYPSHTEAGRTIVLAGPLASAFSAAPSEAQKTFERRATELLGEYATEDGGLSAPMTTLELLALSP
jgi:ubiquinone/menaquinone biosynthesis C-methylase UbiE